MFFFLTVIFHTVINWRLSYNIYLVTVMFIAFQKEQKENKMSAKLFELLLHTHPHTHPYTPHAYDITYINLYIIY